MDGSARPQRVRRLPSWQLTQAAARAQRMVTEALHAHGSHQHQYVVLAATEEFGPCSQAALGRHTGLDRSDIAAVVATLDREGLVLRDADPGNRRRNRVSLTEEGAARLARLDDALAPVQDRLVAPLSPAQRAELGRLLGAVLDQGDPGPR